MPWVKNSAFSGKGRQNRISHTNTQLDVAQSLTVDVTRGISKDHALLSDFDYLSGGYLEEVGLDGIVHASSSRLSYRFLKVEQYLRNEDSSHDIPYRNEMTDVLMGIHQYGNPLIFVVRGRVSEVNIYYGFPNGKEGYLKAALENAYSELYLGEGYSIEDILGNMGQVWVGFSCGLPSELRDKDKILSEQVERLMRALYGEDYLLVLRVIPVDAGFITGASRAISERLLILRTECERLPWEHVRALQRMYRKTDEILDDCLRVGGWSASLLFASEKKDMVPKIGSYIKGIYSGKQSYPVPVRTFILSRPMTSRDVLYLEERTTGVPVETLQRGPLSTIMDSGRVSVLCRLPFKEFPGFKVGRTVYFDVHQEKAGAVSLELGKIVMGKRETENSLLMPIADLTRHVLIAGVTGSGKTNTCMHLIRQLRIMEDPIPFMVIESAKTTYRKLLTSGEMRDLRVYSLGDETACHFRMNPFEFDKGTNIQSYINSLYALFNAAFILYAPMPYVLYQALHDIYRDKGWNLATGENERGTESPYAFPTLTDLYGKIEEVVESLGYEQRITMDVKAALKTRINSLRLGVKGIMLDTHSSISMQELMEHPTVIELERIGDDEEKAFLIGLFLIKLFEYQKNKGESGGKLRHVTLVEEAHRLLKKVPMEFSTEVSNTKGKALETFCNILSEARAYGEGVIIAEQIPSKLVPDAVKNTNLKIAHRLVDFEERELIGRAANMEEKQREYLSILPRGTAVCHFEGLDLPMMVRVPLVLDTLGASGEVIQDATKESFAEIEGLKRLAFRYGFCEKFCKEPCRWLDAARDFTEDQGFVSRFQALMLASFSEGEPTEIRENLFEIVKEDINRVSGRKDDESLIFCVFLNSYHTFLSKATRRSKLGYSEIEAAELKFADSIARLLQRRIGGEELDAIGINLRKMFESVEKQSSVCAYICGGKGCFYRIWVWEKCTGESLREWTRIYRHGREKELYGFTLELVRGWWPTLFTVKAKETIKVVALCLTHNMMSCYGTPTNLQAYRIKRFTNGYPWDALGV